MKVKGAKTEGVHHAEIGVTHEWVKAKDLQPGMRFRRWGYDMQIVSSEVYPRIANRQEIKYLDETGRKQTMQPHSDAPFMVLLSSMQKEEQHAQ